MKRILLFLATNVAVMLVLSVVLRVLGVDQFLASGGLKAGMLVIFSAVSGFAGSFISLLMSKTMAKWSTGAKVIETPQSADEQWLVGTVRRLSEKAGVGMPEVAGLRRRRPMPLPPGRSAHPPWSRCRQVCCIR